MKKLFILLVMSFFIVSCSNKEDEKIEYKPIFKLVSFGKTESLCTAIIEVQGLHSKFSIDGLIKENEINSFEIIAPKGKNIS